MKPLFLIGFMGSGKTTLGRALAAATGLRFVDLDDEIEHRTALSIPQIFSLHGEEAFREIERRTLAALAGESDIIIACGGGTPCFFDNIDLMNAAGTTILLEATPSRLQQRLLEAQSHRPLIADMTPDRLLNYINSAIAQRSAHYNKALHRFDANRLETIEMINESVDRFVKQFNITMP